MSGPMFTPRHSCRGKKRIVPREKCSACIRGIPYPEDVPKPDLGPFHFCRFTTALCGVVAPKRRVQQDRQVTCEACLLKRMELLGMGIAARSLNRASRDPETRLAMLRAAIKNLSRLRVWVNDNPRPRRKTA